MQRTDIYNGDGWKEGPIASDELVIPNHAPWGEVPRIQLLLVARMAASFQSNDPAGFSVSAMLHSASSRSCQ